MENSMEVPSKIKNRTTTWFSNLTSGYIFKQNQISFWKRHLKSHAHCSTIHHSQNRKHPKCLSVNECIESVTEFYHVTTNTVSIINIKHKNIKHKHKASLGNYFLNVIIGLPWWSSGKESTSQYRGHGVKPWSGKIPHATEQLYHKLLHHNSWACTLKPLSHNYF